MDWEKEKERDRTDTLCSELTEHAVDRWMDAQGDEASMRVMGRVEANPSHASERCDPFACTHMCRRVHTRTHTPNTCTHACARTHTPIMRSRASAKLRERKSPQAHRLNVDQTLSSPSLINDPHPPSPGIRIPASPPSLSASILQVGSTSPSKISHHLLCSSLFPWPVWLP